MLSGTFLPTAYRKDAFLLFSDYGMLDSVSRSAAHSAQNDSARAHSLALGAHGGAQLFYDFVGGLAGFILLRNFE
jgi:hypothetical protein